jgi:DNA repair exonuclease SbcCD ATPase subunit
MKDTAGQHISFDEVKAAAASLEKAGKPVSIEAVRDLLGAGTPAAIQKHLMAWRANNAKPVVMPKAEIPPEILADLGRWAQQFAEDAAAGFRDHLAESESDIAVLVEAGEELEAERAQLLGQVASLTAERDEAQLLATERADEIERLTAELRNARQVAMDALVHKAKDQLAIDGKDAQLAELRTQLERNVAASAAESDARLAAEMELVGVTTERDSMAGELKDLRAQLDASRTERSKLRAELETLRARGS